MNVYAVILAGGTGERLWPLSREDRPTQLLPCVDDHSLLEDTLDRLDGLIPSANRFIITTEQQKETINSLVGSKINEVIVEPASRNTAPAILLSCEYLARKNIRGVLVFLPADHFIPDTKKFQQSLLHAVQYAQNHATITLLGVKPTFPATGYGYIEYTKNPNTAVGPVVTFHEKPAPAVAQKYYNNEHMLWNIGIFCAQNSVFTQQFKQYAPDLYQEMQTFLTTTKKSDYDHIPSISFDYAIMEKSDDITVLPVEFSWSDVGNLEQFLLLRTRSEQESASSIIAIDAKNNLVAASSNKIVALLGVHDLCVVETDDALLVMKRSDAEKVKLIITELKRKGLDRYL